MRLLFLILLLANAVAFGYIRFVEGRPGAGSQIALLQIGPEKIKLLKPRAASAGAKEQAAATRPPPVQACLEWGGFTADDSARAAAALAPLALGDKVTQREAGETYWVYIPPLKTKADADKKAADVRTLGIADFYVVPEGDQWKFAISLGMFKTEEAATNYLAQLRQKGVRSAVVGPRGVKTTAFVIRDPTDAVAAKIAELKAEFPASTLKAAACGDAVAAKTQ